MRAATGRDPDDVQTAARCLLALLAPPDPSPEQVAAAHLLAFMGLDLHLAAERLKG